MCWICVETAEAASIVVVTALPFRHKIWNSAKEAFNWIWERVC